MSVSDILNADTLIQLKLSYILVLIGLLCFVIGFFVRDLEFLIDEIVLYIRRRRQSKSITRQ